MMRIHGVLLVSAAFLSACAEPTTTCTTNDNGGRVCVPTAAPENTALTLRARPNGCSNVCNGSSTFTCTVTVSGSRLNVALVQESCVEEDNSVPLPFRTEVACAEICQLPDPVDCAVPPLAAGTYTVATADNTDTQLVVAATGETTCQAPPPF